MAYIDLVRIAKNFNRGVSNTLSSETKFKVLS